jgi:hypothetical protein
MNKVFCNIQKREPPVINAALAKKNMQLFTSNTTIKQNKLFKTPSKNENLIERKES